MWRGICGKKRRFKRSEVETILRQEKPNSLQRALVSADAGPHPDANVLTAFAEDALLPRERESVLAHVACCAECREVLSLSGSAAGPYAVASPAAHRKRTGWRIAVPLLAAAAMIAVVSTLVLRHVVNNPQQNATVAKNAEVTANQPAPTTAVSPPTEAGASAQKERRREDRRPAPLATGPVVVTPPTPVPPAIAANVAPSPPRQRLQNPRSDKLRRLACPWPSPLARRLGWRCKRLRKPAHSPTQSPRMLWGALPRPRLRDHIGASMSRASRSAHLEMAPGNRFCRTAARRCTRWLCL